MFVYCRNYKKYYEQAQKVRRLVCDDYHRVYASGVDVLLTPTMLGDAPTHNWYTQADNQTRIHEFDVFTQAANLAGVLLVIIMHL